MQLYTIYKIAHNKSEKYYIGVTCQSLIKRLKQHKQNKKRTKLTSWLKKYNDCYIVPLKDSLSFESAKDLEKELVSFEIIKTDANILNMCEGGIIPPSRIYWSAKQRERHAKITQEIGKRPKTDEQKRKMALAQIGDKNHNFGRKASESTKLKMTNTHLGNNNHFYGKKHKNDSKIIMSNKKKKYFKLISPDGTVVEGFGIVEFCKKNKLDMKKMFKLLKRKILSYKNWKAYND